MAQVPKSKRVFNKSTGCYKIDLYVYGVYVCSTDQAKTCREAKRKYIERTKTENYVYAEYATQ